MRGTSIGNCGFESRRCYPEDNSVWSLFAFYLTSIIQDAVGAGYFVSTQGRNSEVVKSARLSGSTPAQTRPKLKCLYCICSCKKKY